MVCIIECGLEILSNWKLQIGGIMKIKHFGILTILFVFCFSNAIIFAFPNTDVSNSSSISRYELGKRYLKLGNTYRESKDYKNALKFLQDGQNIFRKQNNIEEKYWYAVSLEYLGYYYRDIHQPHNASISLSKAKAIFSDIITQENGSQFAINDNAVSNRKFKMKMFHNEEHFSPDMIHSDNISFANNDAKIKIRSHHNMSDDNFDNIRMPLQTNRYNVNFDNRNLTDFPGNFTGNRIDNLSISNNQLKRLPEKINYFNTLQTLNVSNNQISQFPYLDNLKRLTYLNLSNNQLNEVGSSIGHLHSLKYLNLSNNPNLYYISNEIFKLKNLEILDVSNTSLPRYLIDDLITNLHNTNVIYSTIPTTNNVIETNDDWDEDDDWDDWEDF